MCVSTPAPFSPEDARSVREFTASLGLPGLIDVHTHFMPKRVLDKVWAYFDSAGPMIGRAWPITYRAEEDARVATLRSFGVLGYSSMIYPHKPGMGHWLNGWAIDFAAAHPDCLQTATFYPEPTAAGYVADAVAAGARIFKSHIQVGDYSPDDPMLDPVWEQILAGQIPVVIHCGSGPAPGTHTGPEPIRRLLGRFPSLPLIIAHMGMPEYSDFLDLAERYENVYLDTTMAFTDFTEQLMPFPAELLGRLGDLRHKVLFGSDFPNIPYSYRHALDACARLGLGDDWLGAVCFGNATQLFGIGQGTPRG